MISVFDNGPPAPCPAPFNMAAHILAHADELAEKPALEVLHREASEIWTYGELKSAILGTGTGLLRLGLKPGDRVLMRLGNTVDFPITYLAAIAIGGIPVPTSTQLSMPEVNAITDEIGPSLIVAGDGVSLPDAAPCPILTSNDLQSMASLPAADFDMGEPNRHAYIIYTSGTGGRPRAVIHGHRAIWARRMMIDGWYGLGRSDRLFHAGAFNWTYTLGTGLMDPWSVGACALIPGSDIGPADIGALLSKYDATIFAAAPGVFRQLLRHPLPALPQLRHGLSAGEKLPLAIHHKWQTATHTPIYEAFGMSECSTFISAHPGHAAPEGALGYPQTGRRVAILGSKGPTKRGQPGVIAVSARDPGLMLGYFGAIDETRARYQGEWFCTGDTGIMDETGAITYLGRDDDMMNAGGYRVSPIEVESAMRLHPGITDCAAVEVPIKADTTVIAAFYTGQNVLDDKILNDHAAANLARYKQPRLFVRQSELPRGANNKLLRRALRENFTITKN